MKVSISRSVGRAFAVMELFREAQEPASATELSRRLGAPHSSVVAILHNLRELGYLSFDELDMTYFPTTKLLDLSAWLGPAPRRRDDLKTLVDRVARDTGHLTALSARLSLFVNTVLLRPGRFSNVAAPARSVGATLTSSVYGHVILSQLDDGELADVVRETESWQRHAGARSGFDKAAMLANIDQARRTGFLTGGHPFCRGTEIIAYAVKDTADAPCVVAVHFPTCLSREGKDDIRQKLQIRLQGCGQPAGRVQRAPRPELPAPVLRRPAGHAGTFSPPYPAASPGARPRVPLLAAQGDAR